MDQSDNKGKPADEQENGDDETIGGRSFPQPGPASRIIDIDRNLLSE